MAYEMLMLSGIHLWTRCWRSDLTAWGEIRDRLLTRSISCHVASQVLIAFDREAVRDLGVDGRQNLVGIIITGS